MKTLNKVFAAVGSLVLAMALMVPTLAWADDGDKIVRVNYAGTPIELSELGGGTPHSISITFHVNANYDGYADADKDVEFALADTPEMKKLRVAGAAPDDDGSYTVILSNGNEALPLTDGSYLDLGTLNVKIDGTLDEDSEDEAAMREASVVVTALSTSNSMFYTTRSIEAGASGAEKVVPFTLANSSFESVTTGTPGQTTDPGQTPGGNGGSGGGTDNSGDQANQANKANQPSQKAAPIRRLEPIGGNLATTGDQNMPILLVVAAVAACAAVAAAAFVFTRKKKGSE